jgi:DNA-binding beta-propeller fold protein YncE
MGQLLFDNNGYYAVACYSSNKVVLYNSVNTFVTSVTTGASPQMAMIDDVGRFVVATNADLDFFY